MYVYFIAAGDRGPIKIGRARNVDKRLETLQTGNHLELILLATIYCHSSEHAAEVEHKLHRIFKKQRIRGEWFKRNISIERAKAYMTEAADSRKENKDVRKATKYERLVSK